MGKGVKRKNPGVGIDFKKAKYKVGRKLQKAKNETDVNFKAQKISLAVQSISDAAKGGAATNARNLTLKELVSQCGHYSDKVRKSALQGMGDLFAQHPAELQRHVGTVIEALSERLTDQDRGVREALQALLHKHVLPAISAAALSPFLPRLMAHVSAAMTHLATLVQKDGLKVLYLIMDHSPAAISSRYLAPSLHHFCHVFSQRSRTRSIKARSLPNLLTSVEGLHRFLARAVESTTEGASSEVGDQRRGSGGLRTLYPNALKQPPAEAQSATAAPILDKLRRPGPRPAKAELEPNCRAAGMELAEQASVLLDLLVECWLECGGSEGEAEAAEEGGELQGLRCRKGILDSMVLLLQLLQRGGGARTWPNWRRFVERHLLPQFPAVQPAVERGREHVEVLGGINLASAAFLSLCAQQCRPANASTAAGRQAWGEGAAADSASASPASLALISCAAAAAAPAPAEPRPAAAPAPEPSAAWVQTLMLYYCGVLSSRAVVPEAGGLAPGADAGRQPAQADAAVAAALRGVRAALPSVEQQLRQQLLQSVATFAQQLPPPTTPQRKRKTESGAEEAPAPQPHLQLQVELLQLQQQLLADPEAALFGRADPNGPLLGYSVAAQLLAAAPRQLYQLANCRCYQGAALVLENMHVLVRVAQPGDPLHLQLPDVRLQLVPSFWLPPAPGKKRAAAAAPGPIWSAPLPVQQLAADLWSLLPAPPCIAVRMAAAAALAAAAPAATAGRLLRGVAAAAAPADWLALLSSLLTRSCSLLPKAAALRGPAEHRLLLRVLAEVALLRGPGWLCTSLDALFPTLSTELCRSSCSMLSRDDGTSPLLGCWAAIPAAASQASCLPTLLPALPGLLLLLTAAHRAAAAAGGGCASASWLSCLPQLLVLHLAAAQLQSPQPRHATGSCDWAELDDAVRLLRLHPHLLPLFLEQLALCLGSLAERGSNAVPLQAVTDLAATLVAAADTLVSREADGPLRPALLGCEHAAAALLEAAEAAARATPVDSDARATQTAQTQSLLAKLDLLFGCRPSKGS